MKRNINFERIFFLFAIIGIIISFFIIYKNIDTPIAIKIVKGFVIYDLVYLVYMIFATIVKMRKLDWVNVKRRIFKFIISFTSSSFLLYISVFVFRPSEIDLFRIFSISLGSAFGILFVDVNFLEKKNI